MPLPLTKTHPTLDLKKAQEQVRTAIGRAVQECGGSEKELADRINVHLTRAGHKPITRQAVQWWRNQGTFVDDRFFEPIERATDYLVTRRQLRPDLYQDESCELTRLDLQLLLDSIALIEDAYPPGSPNYMNALRALHHLRKLRAAIVAVHGP